MERGPFSLFSRMEDEWPRDAARANCLLDLPTPVPTTMALLHELAAADYALASAERDEMAYQACVDALARRVEQLDGSRRILIANTRAEIQRRHGAEALATALARLLLLMCHDSPTGIPQPVPDPEPERPEGCP